MGRRGLPASQKGQYLALSKPKAGSRLSKGRNGPWQVRKEKGMDRGTGEEASSRAGSSGWTAAQGPQGTVVQPQPLKST